MAGPPEPTVPVSSRWSPDSCEESSKSLWMSPSVVLASTMNPDWVGTVVVTEPLRSWRVMVPIPLLFGLAGAGGWGGGGGGGGCGGVVWCEKGAAAGGGGGGFVVLGGGGEGGPDDLVCRELH